MVDTHARKSNADHVALQMSSYSWRFCVLSLNKGCPEPHTEVSSSWDANPGLPPAHTLSRPGWFPAPEFPWERDSCQWLGADGSVFPLNTPSWQQGSRREREGERQTLSSATGAISPLHRCSPAQESSSQQAERAHEDLT